MKIVLVLVAVLLATVLAAGVWFYSQWGPVNEQNIAREVAAQSAALHGAAVILATIDHGLVKVYSAGDTGTARPLDDRTIFEIGSVTKVFTGTILASDVLHGSLSLDEPVAKLLPADFHVPSFQGREITLLDLATQHSGLPKLPTNLDLAAPDVYAQYDAADLRTFLLSFTLPRAPGVKYEYSNVGFGLLGYALTLHDGHSFEDLVHDRITGPLGMNDTVITVPSGLDAYVAKGRDADGGDAPSWHFTDALGGAGALRSNLADMVVFLKANMSANCLHGACAFAQTIRSESDQGHIGLGWENSGFPWKNGQTAGYHAFIGISRNRKFGVVLLSNAGSFDLDRLPMRLLIYRT